MLQEAGIYVRFLVTLALTIAFAVLFRPLSEKLSRKLAPKHPVEEQQLVGLGIAPLFAGLLVDSFLMAFQYVIFPFVLISLAALIGWGIIAFRWEAKIQKTWKIVLFQNLIPAAVFVLICIQQLGMGRFWIGIVGAWSQLFYVPFLSVASLLTRWSESMFPAFCAAFVLLLVASAAGCLLARKRRADKKRGASMRMITLLLTGSVMGVWFLSMIPLTVVTAQEMYDALYEKSFDFSDYVIQFGTIHDFYDETSARNGYQYERPDFLENQMLFTIDNNSSASYHTGRHYDSYSPLTGKSRNKLIRNYSYPMETAVLFYDADGNLLHSSEDDILYFSYFTQEEWDAGRDSAYGLHYGWIDISTENGEEDLYARFHNVYAGVRNLRDIASIRVTGYFEGNELKPVVMHYVTENQVWEAAESTDQFYTDPDSLSYILSDVDRTGLLEWQLQFDLSAEYEDKELVTVYIERPEMWDYPENALTYGGMEYENLTALTETLNLPLDDDNSCYDRSIFKLQELLVFDRWVGAEFGKEYVETGETTVDFYLVTAIRSNPLVCAIGALRNVYLVTGLLALVLLLVVRSAIKNRLVKPVRTVVAAMEDDWSNIWYSGHEPDMWQEAEKLHVAFSREQGRRRRKDQEITRLNTALEYAKAAEQNRRRLTSNIAHELKTPLAVIHSYAEGLKEHIAEDKRDKYLEIILSETERTDSMVLEMLDLSRLEAGKVKLSQDEFSLGELARAIFGKLEMAAQAKQLQIDFDLPERSVLVADENRIGQVVENFASNAVRYTPGGGRILVRVQQKRSKMTFSVENDSRPLSREELERVWDSFYRTDESRNERSTGLGLAIAKSIIELHGGECFARNTKTGVEFGFTI